MKIKIIACLFLTVLPFLSFTSKANLTHPLKADLISPAEGGYYAFLTIDGTWSKEKKAYISEILYYPGYSECEKEDYRFEQEAKDSFNTYLKAEYENAFPYGSINILCISGSHGSLHGTSAMNLKTRQQAQDEVNYWIVEQQKDGYTVVHTDFSFSCEKD